VSEREKQKRRQKEQELLLQQIQNLILLNYFSMLNMDAVKKAINDGNDGFFFANNYSVNRKAERQLAEMARQMDGLLRSCVEKSWKQGEDDFWVSIKSVLNTKTPAQQNGFDDIQSSVKAHLDNTAQSFYNEKRNGFNISDRVWNIAGNAKNEIEVIIQNGIKEGKAATEIQKSLKEYLNEPDKLFRRVRNKETGELEWSKAALKYKPGRGVYRSARMNAMRLARTETNAAYRRAEWESYQNNPLIIGYEICLSNNHTTLKNGKVVRLVDICDELAGVYPKTFLWTGWHPQCYDELSEVYTDKGWKFFRDVQDNDKILSINTNTLDLEYANIALTLKKEHSGEMIRFYNRSLDILVTPEHEMLVISKQGGNTFRRIVAKRCGVTQPIYRSSEWRGSEQETIQIGDKTFDFRYFCEFMGYWLSDGSLGHKWAVVISQQDENRSNIFKCIDNLYLSPRYNGGKVEVNDRSLYEYLRQFGKCYEKYIPVEIKNATQEKISIFLNAFISCDGHIAKPRSFIGNRGTLCNPREGRTYFTTSKQMADDLGELILKVGRRPSFRVEKTAGEIQLFKNGFYEINHNLIIVSQCYSTTATQYKKETVMYDGFVYDLTLDRNNTMYIRRNGKCFWGSNCRCYMLPIQIDDDDFDELLKAERNGELDKWKPKNVITEMPKAFNDWIKNNHERLEEAMNRWTLPYWLKDNESIFKTIHEKMVDEVAVNRLFEKENKGRLMFIDPDNKGQPLQDALRFAKDKNLTEAETRAINMYSDREYQNLNPSLRDEKMIPELTSLKNVLNRGLDKLNPFEGIVYRGTDLPDDVLQKYIDAFNTKGVVTEKAFTSTTIIEQVAKDWGYVVFEIVSKTGRDISALTKFGTDESEILFKSGIDFKVTNISQYRGRYTIIMEEI
jgi:hypothetical protein